MLAVVPDDRVCPSLSLLLVHLLLVETHCFFCLPILRLVTLRGAMGQLSVVVHHLLGRDLLVEVAIWRLASEGCSFLGLSLRAVIEVSLRARRQTCVRGLTTARHHAIVL